MRYAALLLVTALLLPAQSRKAFEVVSIKPTTDTMMSLARAGQKVESEDDAQAVYRGVSLFTLLQYAYDLPYDQIVAPSWLDGVNFNIDAKLPAGSTRKDIPEMLQTLLTERFKLTVHHDEKTRVVYLLTVGKGETKIKPAAGGDSANNGCHNGAGGHHHCQNVTMETFAEFLSTGWNMQVPSGAPNVWLDRQVVDKTGLKGAYDFEMEFGCMIAEKRRCGPEDAANLVPIREGVKNLGFVLEPGKAPYPILVVDHIERVPVDQ